MTKFSAIKRVFILADVGGAVQRVLQCRCTLVPAWRHQIIDAMPKDLIRAGQH